MQEADRGGTRLRLRRTRQGTAPWATFKFLYRERGMLLDQSGLQFSS